MQDHYSNTLRGYLESTNNAIQSSTLWRSKCSWKWTVSKYVRVVHVVITTLKGGGYVTADICLSVSTNIKVSLVGSAANSALEPVRSS